MVLPLRPLGQPELLTIAIVTCWLDHPELAGDYVEAVLPEFRGGDQHIIVDNGGTPELPFFVVSPGENLGFARGSNYGMAHASADAVVFLNNDVCLGKRGWLDENGMHQIRLTQRSLGPIDFSEWSGIILGGGPYNVSDPPDSKTSTQRRVESELASLTHRIVDRDSP